MRARSCRRAGTDERTAALAGHVGRRYLWRQHNNLAVTLGHPDGADVEWADLFYEVRKLRGPPDPLRHEHNWVRVLEAIKVLEAEWDGLEPVHKRTMRERLRAFALRIKEDRPEG